MMRRLSCHSTVAIGILNDWLVRRGVDEDKMGVRFLFYGQTHARCALQDLGILDIL